MLDQGNFDAADELLTKTVTFPEAHVRAHALAAIGWMHMHRDPPDPARALEAFTKTIAETQRPDMPDAEAARRLRTQARRDLVAAYAAAGRIDRARAFFERVGRGPDGEDMVDEMLARLDDALTQRDDGPR